MSSDRVSYFLGWFINWEVIRNGLFISRDGNIDKRLRLSILIGRYLLLDKFNNGRGSDRLGSIREPTLEVKAISVTPTSVPGALASGSLSKVGGSSD